MKTSKKVALILVMLALFLITVSSTASAATLNVGPKEEYKTIQSAVNAAQDGDTIKVAYDTYNENVEINKGELTFLGTEYPNVDGFNFKGGSGEINGFTIQKDGVSTDYAGGGIIRNNYFYNCGISLNGLMGGATIINNQITNGSISLYDTRKENITDNIISNCSTGLYVGDLAWIPTVTNNTFKNCDTAVYLYGWEQDPGRLPSFSGNKYINNKVNIGWGTKPF
jgi:parallel beta-helix repeat protein